MTKKSYKELITETILKQLPENYVDFSKEEALKKWWYTGPNSEVLRLSEIGDTVFRLAEIESYKYDFSAPKNTSYYNYMLDLGKKMKCPYFIGVNKIEGEKTKPYIKLYDSKIAIMLSLYGDLNSYLKSVRISR